MLSVPAGTQQQRSKHLPRAKSWVAGHVDVSVPAGTQQQRSKLKVPSGTQGFINAFTQDFVLGCSKMYRKAGRCAAWHAVMSYMAKRHRGWPSSEVVRTMAFMRFTGGSMRRRNLLSACRPCRDSESLFRSLPRTASWAGLRCPAERDGSDAVRGLLMIRRFHAS